MLALTTCPVLCVRHAFSDWVNLWNTLWLVEQFSGITNIKASYDHTNKSTVETSDDWFIYGSLMI